MFKKLPSEIKSYIFEHLELGELKNCRVVCQGWNQFISESHFFINNTVVCITPEQLKTKHKLDLTHRQFKSLKLSVPSSSGKFSSNDIAKLNSGKVINLNSVKNLTIEDVKINGSGKLKILFELFKACHTLKHITFRNVQIKIIKLFGKKNPFTLDGIDSLSVYESLDILEYLKIDKLEKLDLSYGNLSQQVSNEKHLVNFLNGLTKLNKLSLSNVSFFSDDLILTPKFRWRELNAIDININSPLSANASQNWQKLFLAVQKRNVKFYCLSESISTFYILLFLKFANIEKFDTFTLNSTLMNFQLDRPLESHLLSGFSVMFEHDSEKGFKIENLHLANPFSYSSLNMTLFLDKFIDSINIIENLHVYCENFVSCSRDVVQKKCVNVKHLVIDKINYQFSNFSFRNLHTITIQTYEKEADVDHMKRFAENHRFLQEIRLGTNVSRFDKDMNFFELYQLMPHLNLFSIASHTMTRDEIELKHFQKILSNDEREKIRILQPGKFSFLKTMTMIYLIPENGSV